jgi:hypothetical protein
MIYRSKVEQRFEIGGSLKMQAMISKNTYNFNSYFSPVSVTKHDF